MLHKTLSVYYKNNIYSQKNEEIQNEISQTHALNYQLGTNSISNNMTSNLQLDTPM